jgi:hypothetical protein
MCVAKSIPVVATGVLHLYPSGVEPHISLSLDKPKCKTSRVDIKPDKNNKNRINVVQGYTNSGTWNITSAFVLSYRPSLCHPYDTFRCHLSRAFPVLYWQVHDAQYHTTIERKYAFNRREWGIHKRPLQ